MDSEYRDDTIYGSFETIADKNKPKTALIYLGENYSYGQLKEMVLRFAASLRKLGVGEGDKVLIYLNNLPQTVIAYLALHRINAVPVPVAPIYTTYDLRYFVNDLKIETIICMDSNLSYASEILHDTSLKKIIVTNMIDLVSWWKKIIAHAYDRVPKGKTPSGEEFFFFKKLLREGDPSALPPYRPPDGNKTALILYTGGTTGEPKGVPLSMGLYMHQLREWRKISEPIIPPGGMIAAQAAPMYHVIGQCDGMTPILVDGGTLVIFPRVDLDAIMDHIQRLKVTNMFGVPQLYRMILEHDRIDNYDLRSLKYCGCGGDVLSNEVAHRWYDKIGTHLMQGYGVTEICGPITLSYARDGIPPEGSIGKAVQGLKTKLVDPATLEPVPQGESGDLLVTIPYGTKHYWNKPEESEISFLTIDGDVWYRTHDVVRIDEEGWFYFMDRTADIIKHKGYRIAAAEIEKVLQEHPAVISSCVIGIPDKKVGERIKAFVVLKEDVKGVNARELTNWCRERTASYKVPHYIEFRDMLPKSKVGKMLRREMRSEELGK
ncbi:MAG: AMP-binding protein [Deltaproteobacteria bacterium]|nr:AMP-binding protein [Deltaproteobacteria bacterium]